MNLQMQRLIAFKHRQFRIHDHRRLFHEQQKIKIDRRFCLNYEDMEYSFSSSCLLLCYRITYSNDSIFDFHRMVVMIQVDRVLNKISNVYELKMML